MLDCHHPSVLALRDEMVRAVEEMAESTTHGRLIVIAGLYGSGKTHCARNMVKWFSAASTRLPLDSFDRDKVGLRIADAWFYSWPEIIDGFKTGNWDVVDSMMEHSFMVLDDVGAEHDPSSVGQAKLCQVLSRREKRWTIITTNVPPKLWDSKFDRRIASRFLRNSTIIDMSGCPDYSTV